MSNINPSRRRRRKRLRRRLRKAAEAAQLARDKGERAGAVLLPSASPSVPPGPTVEPGGLAWPGEAELSRAQIRAKLDNAGIEYDGRTSTAKLTALLTEAAKVADDGNGG